MKLTGKFALVTGGSAGIGLATAKALVAEGAHVFITGRRQAELGAAIEEIGAHATAIQADAANLADLDRMIVEIRKDAGQLDVIVANAGSYEMESLADVTEASFDKTFGLNVRGVLFTVQKALPLLKDGASIVLLGSIGGSKGFAGFSVYNATKASVRSFARSWAAEFKDRRIRVNVVSPGPVQTPGFDQFANDEMRDSLKSMIPLGRMATPADVANAIRYLATDDSSFVTGIELFVDGGLAQL
ncbi:SDR family NAD(P)-dependent oxidoreductase [Pseudoduganella lutea]|uniref:Glucose 1-dehydrogenase n=1 Tax=Pseudoduganella lutea TaxID=321985 RepID=A0A4P6L4K9_9BURK|nr:glucose 1-dehydrogenase [Pseudoduganella lutea]QBE66384.1 glucose 1-dehydrogenase [Pseudoduganella lutea]